MSDDPSFKVINRIPSYADVASVMATYTEEIVFTKGYNFKIGIYDRNMVRRAKYRITRHANKKGWKETDPFFKIERFLKGRKRKIEREVKKKKLGALESSRMFRRAWLEEIERYGVRVTRVVLDGGKMYVV